MSHIYVITISYDRELPVFLGSYNTKQIALESLVENVVDSYVEADDVSPSHSEIKNKIKKIRKGYVYKHEGGQIYQCAKVPLYYDRSRFGSI